MANTSPLLHAPFSAKQSCEGHLWEIIDENQLAIYVAEILVAHHEHVLEIIGGSSISASSAKESVVNSVLNQILPTPKNDTQRYHRDGLLFQHIAWIAAATVREEGDLFSVPHTKPAQKGQDMLIVHTNESAKEVAAVTICEDKATEHPRSKIKQEVFPEISNYERGFRDAELESETLTILERHKNKVEARELVDAIFWQSLRRYRINVTSSCPQPVTVKKLFKDYENVAKGDIVRRKGGVFDIDSVRNWFDCFSGKVAKALKAMLEVSVDV